MLTKLQKRLAAIEQSPGLLSRCLRGLEKEGLRTSPTGHLAMTPHPVALGSALTHPHITTDYAESLLELITSTHSSVDSLLQAVEWVHRLTADGLGDELLWNHSMPAILPSEEDIPIAWYGESNTGMLKHVYRRGLAHRYGKTMQCIAGIHYNFSFDPDFWEHLDLEGESAQTRASAGYVSLIRNFVRHSWLLMYLFGASPVLNKQFVRGKQTSLQELDSDTLYLPWATSLRMSDLGYQNKAQSTLKPCYNDLPTFLQRMYEAVATPWPEYQTMGTHQNGEWIQLNCNLLQIENEYYSTIRPKRTTGRGERPITALSERGIQYIEVRCLDIDPFEPAGISAHTARFMDAFLLFCALQSSPDFGEDGFCQESAENFSTVVKEGRKPGLELRQGGIPITLSGWAEQIFEGIRACATLLSEQTGDPLYLEALDYQHAKVLDISLTPSARVLETLKETHSSFHAFGLETSREYTLHFKRAGLTEAERKQAEQMRLASVQAQDEFEADRSVSFEEYVRQFHAALKAPM
ncbi:glutamate--cysteine ligase [Orrella marina]|uniref:Glutamate--cysteine ligase n=1 Tax=Orrella marina TaxID=2163011 RepID=A0A2R4XMM9_9BURK|nr:glutamate--cysteine ligase [Orrella marina]AWB35062.1 glutamate--cysteine ligase [Orrella marina]